MWELTKTFRFEAAHTLVRSIDSQASARIHGHSYRTVIAVQGEPDQATGMLVDLGALERQLASTRSLLDHRLLDDVDDLGPATLENLSAWIWRQVASVAPGLVRVTVYRDSLDEACSYFGPSK
jgi:6-pyruvoyltetrahydropterin/6-carboxytetrahydropterin synthase